MGSLSELLGKGVKDRELAHEDREARAADKLLSETGALASLNMEHHGAWEGESELEVGRHVVDEETGEHRVETLLISLADPSIEIAVGVASPTTNPEFYVRSGGEIVLRTPKEEGGLEKITSALQSETRRAIDSGLLHVRVIPAEDLGLSSVNR